MLLMGNCLLMSVEQNKGGMVTVIKNHKVTLLSCFMVLAMVFSLLLPVNAYYALFLELVGEMSQIVLVLLSLMNSPHQNCF